MAAEFEENQFLFRFFLAVEQPEAKSDSALKQIGTKFPDSRSSMGVRLSPCFQDRHQCLVHRRTILYGKFAQSAKEPFGELNLPRGLRFFR